MLAAHLGVVDEDQINNMSYIFFEDVLSELGHKLNYDAVVNYAGNSFCEKSWDMIQESNPFEIGTKKTNISNEFMSMLSSAPIIEKGKGEKEDERLEEFTKYRKK